MKLNMSKMLSSSLSMSKFTGSHRYFVLGITHTGLDRISEIISGLFLRFISELSRSLEDGRPNPSSLFKNDQYRAVSTEKVLYKSIIPMMKGETDEERIVEFAKMFNYYKNRNMDKYVEELGNYTGDVINSLTSVARIIASGNNIDSIKQYMKKLNSKNDKLTNLFLIEREHWTLVDPFSGNSDEMLFKGSKNDEDTKVLTSLLKKMQTDTTNEDHYFNERISLKRSTLFEMAKDTTISKEKRAELMEDARHEDISSKIRTFESTISRTMDRKTYETILELIDRGEFFNLNRIDELHEEFIDKLKKTNDEVDGLINEPEIVIEDLIEEGKKVNEEKRIEINKRAKEIRQKKLSEPERSRPIL